MRERQKCALEEKVLFVPFTKALLKFGGSFAPSFPALLYLESSPDVCGLVASLNGKVQLGFFFLGIIRNSLFFH